MALPSIRRRLSRTLLATALAWGLAVSLLVWLAVRHEVNELLDDTLRASSEVLAGLLQSEADVLARRGPVVPPGPSVNVHFAWQLVGPGERVVLRSSLAPAAAFAAAPRSGFFSGGADWRVYGVRFDDTRTLYVAQTRDERREALAEVSLSSVLAALLVGAVTAIGLRGRVRRELQPVDAIADTLARYEPLDPQATLDPPTRAEMVPVHDAVTALGRRLVQRVASERAFTAHAAHALRTPLAGIDAQLAVALREAPPGLAPRLQRVRSAAGRLSRVVAALLALFRTGTDLRRDAVDVAHLLARLPVEGLEVRVDDGAPAVDADPDLLAAALLNLLDNAVRHGARQVRVQLAPRCVTLHDDGRGTDDARRAAMQAALDRQDWEDRSSGLGLGLMLADLVARAHGGRLRLLPAPAGFAVALGLGPGGENAAP